MLSFEDFLAEYQHAFSAMMGYKPGEVGARYWAEKMAKLADDYPEFAVRAEMQN